MKILNSSGLVVEVDVETPAVTSGASWSNASFPHGSVGSASATPKLNGAVQDYSGFGVFSLENRVTGIRGSISVSFVTGAVGLQRTLCYLTDNPTNPTNRLILGVDSLNRPYVRVTNFVGATVAVLNPTFSGIPENLQNLAVFSWDSEQAIVHFMLNRTMPSDDNWTVNPSVAWTSFRPSHLVLGAGVGGDSDFNGRLLSVQVSNGTVAATGTGAGGGTFPANHVFEAILSDMVVVTESTVTS